MTDRVVEWSGCRSDIGALGLPYNYRQPILRHVTDLASVPTRQQRSNHSNALSAAELRKRGHRTALILDGAGDGSDQVVVSYADLADRIDDRGDALGRTRRLVQMGDLDDIEAVVTLCAALGAGHPLIVSEPGRSRHEAAARYQPDTIVSGRGDAFRIDRPTAWSAPSPHELHPDLALLLSTSGTTGGAKLVRLSGDAVVSNARAIAESLDLSESDRAVTSLPLHYCYGLSVVTSHLVAGGSVFITDRSVVDPCFWAAIEHGGVTTLAGVPYTFEMIDRFGTDALSVPALRLVTQAGGRMEPSTVRRYAELGREAGWDFVVMYGQTEATARMAVATPADTYRHPRSVGQAIPGGSFRIGPVPDDLDHGVARINGVGEVIYSGPNVMLGYANEAGDLARGREVTELRTGDLGRLDGSGRLQLVGRASRFVKLHGKRVDLDHVESCLRTTRRTVRCAGDDDGLVVVTVSPGSEPASDDDLRREVRELTAIPDARIVAVRLPDLPRTASGKVDGPALVGAARSIDAGSDDPADDASVADAFAMVLGLSVVNQSASFADLGGDSFSYVEMSIRLERLLGELPRDWHLRPVADLEHLRTVADPRRRSWVRLETGVVIRAVAILLIVCTHMRVFRVPGGAHGLLALAGYNLARFQLLPRDVPGRLRRSVSTIARVAVPTSAWIGVNMVLAGGYSLGAMLLVNNYTGDAARRGGRWEYWYFEVFVQVMVVVVVLFTIPAVRRRERRAPFAFALGVLAVTLLFRFDLVQLGGEYNEVFRTHTVAFFVALGWCAQRADTIAKRAVVSLAAVVTTFGYFGQTDRELRIIAIVLALTWVPTVLLPRPLAAVIVPIAAASMWIFLVHWQVWPLITPWMHNGMAFWLTIASGVGVWWSAGRIGEAGSRFARGWSRRQRRTVGPRTRSQVSEADTAIRRSDETPVSA